AAATAALHRVWVIEREAALLEAVIKVDRGSVEIQSALLIHQYGHAVVFELRIVGFVERVVESQVVRKTAAAAPYHTHAKAGRVGLILILQDLLDFFSGTLAQDNAHDGCSLVYVGDFGKFCRSAFRDRIFRR